MSLSRAHSLLYMASQGGGWDLQKRAWVEEALELASAALQSGLIGEAAEAAKSIVKGAGITLYTESAASRDVTGNLIESLDSIEPAVFNEARRVFKAPAVVPSGVVDLTKVKIVLKSGKTEVESGENLTFVLTNLFDTKGFPTSGSDLELVEDDWDNEYEFNTTTGKWESDLGDWLGQVEEDTTSPIQPVINGDEVGIPTMITLLKATEPEQGGGPPGGGEGF
jgi:hypothetical protein